MLIWDASNLLLFSRTLKLRYFLKIRAQLNCTLRVVDNIRIDNVSKQDVSAKNTLHKIHRCASLAFNSESRCFLKIFA